MFTILQWDHTDSDAGWESKYCDLEYTCFICNRPVLEIEVYGYISVSLLNTIQDSLLTRNECKQYCIDHYGAHLASILTEEHKNQTMQIYDALKADDEQINSN